MEGRVGSAVIQEYDKFADKGNGIIRNQQELRDKAAQLIRWANKEVKWLQVLVRSGVALSGVKVKALAPAPTPAPVIESRRGTEPSTPSIPGSVQPATLRA